MQEEPVWWIQYKKERTPSPEYFQFAVWWTPNQIRDSFLDYSYDLTTEFVDSVRKMALIEQTRRKQSKDFVECPLCKGYHGQLNNIDNLCEIHEASTAPLRYDITHGLKPN